MPSVGAPIRIRGEPLRFQSLHLMRQIAVPKRAAGNKDHLEIAFTLGAVVAIVVFLIGGSRLLVELLAY